MAKSLNPSDLSILQLAGIAPGQTLNAVEYSYPEKGDVLGLLERIYDKTTPPLNCARPLDGNLVITSVLRNSGTDDDKSPGSAGGSSIKVPSPEQLFKIVWNATPDFLKEKIKGWAKNNMRGPIAQEIAEHVKQALRSLPIPIPGVFINFATNLAILPLVDYIVGHIKDIEAGRLLVEADMDKSPELQQSVVESEKSLQINLDLDRKILLRAGLPAREMPAHLRESPDSGSNIDEVEYPSLGQPDRREGITQIKQFYSEEKINGCKPLDLAQAVAAYIRVEPRSNPDAESLGKLVWEALKANDQEKDPKKKQDWASRNNFKNWVQENNKLQISQHLYDPVSYFLQKDCFVPGPLVPAFTSMKVPPVTEYVINEIKY